MGDPLGAIARWALASAGTILPHGSCLTPASGKSAARHPGDPMTLALILLFAAGAILASVIIVRRRPPTAGESMRNLGLDVQRGVRDSLNTAKDASEDARHAVHDATK